MPGHGREERRDHVQAVAVLRLEILPRPPRPIRPNRATLRVLPPEESLHLVVHPVQDTEVTPARDGLVCQLNSTLNQRGAMRAAVAAAADSERPRHGSSGGCGSSGGGGGGSSDGGGSGTDSNSTQRGSVDCRIPWFSCGSFGPGQPLPCKPRYHSVGSSSRDCTSTSTVK